MRASELLRRMGQVVCDNPDLSVVPATHDLYVRTGSTLRLFNPIADDYTYLCMRANERVPEHITMVYLFAAAVAESEGD